MHTLACKIWWSCARCVDRNLEDKGNKIWWFNLKQHLTLIIFNLLFLYCCNWTGLSCYWSWRALLFEQRKPPALCNGKRRSIDWWIKNRSKSSSFVSISFNNPNDRQNGACKLAYSFPKLCTVFCDCCHGTIPPLIFLFPKVYPHSNKS